MGGAAAGGAKGNGDMATDRSVGGRPALFDEAVRQLIAETSHPETSESIELRTFDDLPLEIGPAAEDYRWDSIVEDIGATTPGALDPELSEPRRTVVLHDPLNPEAAWSQPYESGATPVLAVSLLVAEQPAGLASPAAVVAEPGTLVLFGSGLMGLAAWSRRAKTKRNARVILDS